MLSAASVTITPLLGDVSLGEAFVGVDFSTPGLIDLFLVSLLSPPELDSLQPESFVLATFSFDAIAPGTSALALTQVLLGVASVDRSIKKSRYAAAGSPELWNVDLEGARVWVHRKPLEGDYGEIFEARPGDVLKVPGMPDIEIPVAELVS